MSLSSSSNAEWNVHDRGYYYKADEVRNILNAEYEFEEIYQTVLYTNGGTFNAKGNSRDNLPTHNINEEKYL